MWLMDECKQIQTTGTSCKVNGVQVCGGLWGRNVCTTQGIWRSANEALKEKGQGYGSQLGKRGVVEHQPDPAGGAAGWAGVVFHSWWPLWTAVCRLLNVSLFTLLTRDTLWTLDNCQQHSTPKTAQKRLLSCLAHSFNGGSHKEMAYLHQTAEGKQEMSNIG